MKTFIEAVEFVGTQLGVQAFNSYMNGGYGRLACAPDQSAVDLILHIYERGDVDNTRALIKSEAEAMFDRLLDHQHARVRALEGQ